MSGHIEYKLKFHTLYNMTRREIISAVYLILCVEYSNFFSRI